MFNSFDRIVFSFIGLLLLLTGGIIAFGSHVSVEISAYTPRDQASITSHVRVTFDLAMERRSVERRFKIEPSVTGDFRWEANTLIFVPDNSLLPDQEYTVTVEQGVRSRTGRELSEDFSWSFTARAPMVYYLAPSDARNRALWRSEADGSNPEEVLAPPFGVYDFVSSPDGSQLAVTIRSEDSFLTELFLVNPDGSDIQQITACAPAACGRPAWSPDGAWIAYERQDPASTGGMGPARIWIYSIETGQSGQAFQDNQVLGFEATWNNDGTRLAFFDSNIQAIRVLDITTGESFEVPSLNWENGSFSPDGNQLLYTDIKQIDQSRYASQLWIADLQAESGLSSLLSEPQEDQYPSWSPDGQWIAFGRRRIDNQLDRGRQLWLYNTETEELRQITDAVNYNNSFFRWDPSSKLILIQRFNLEAEFPKTEVWYYSLLSNQLVQVTDDGFGGHWVP